MRFTELLKRLFLGGVIGSLIGGGYSWYWISKMSPGEEVPLLGVYLAVGLSAGLGALAAVALGMVTRK